MAGIFSTHPFYMQYVHKFTPSSPHLIRNNPKLCPFFKGVVGTINGSHININCPVSMCDACCNRKGFLSQNCLFACSFDMLFTYALCGWEGSTSDARLWENAKGLCLPEGCFYWQMQDFHIVKSYLCLIEVVDIIYLKVEANIKGYFYLWINIH